MSSLYLCRPEVADAVASGRPVVALETTVVTHGLPHPDGVRVARALEREVRQHGAVPATIGILHGRVIVGMTDDELDALAGASPAIKTNPSNVGAVLAAGRAGSTTVAATMIAAHANGIRVFATGGIGGVHRGVSETGDVSSDLLTLSRVPVAVVSAGAKAILDLPRTIEWLETFGVPVLGYCCDEFPAFYRRASGLRVDARCDSAGELAAAVAAHWALGLTAGVLIANPIPAEHEMPRDVYDTALTTALAEVESRRISGREVTPFLLDRMRALTGGASVVANAALLRHNARVAAELAVALSADPRFLPAAR
jgi:pseudouridine-5'-phosphate glycosidase